MSDSKELQRPENMHVSYLGGRIERCLESMGYGGAEKGEVAANLAFLYEFAVELIQNINVIIEAPEPDRTAEAVTNIRTSLDHMSQTFIKSSRERLPRLARYLYGLQSSD